MLRLTVFTKAEEYSEFVWKDGYDGKFYYISHH